MTGGHILIILGAVGLIMGLIIVGWRQRPMLELPPPRSVADPPAEVSGLSESERADIARLAQLGMPIDDGTLAPLVAAYCQWQIERFARISSRNWPLWRQILWITMTLMYLTVAIVVVARGMPWLIIALLPLLALRVGFLTGALPRLLARRYRRTMEVNGWTERREA